MEIHQGLFAVVIGRNEGERLKRCLVSLKNNFEKIIYVDSGSTDNSVEMALSQNVHVVNLDTSIPFTAAHARNSGAKYIFENYANVRYIQFVDGDCEVNSNWITSAIKFLDANPEYAVVCGRRRERHPRASIYNELCDLEWDTPIGDALACGGDAMICADAYVGVGGYRGDLIAGEEPEMCFRMRQKGWKIMRLDVEMTLHDAAITSIFQWWRRSKRSGFAYAASFDLHGQTIEHFRQKETRSIVIWGMFIPAIVLFASLAKVEMIWTVLIYPAQMVRLYNRYKDKYPHRTASMLAVSNTLIKFPQACGVIRYLIDRFRDTKTKIIEYK